MDSPPTFRDLNMNVKEDYLPFPVINKGIVLKENLRIIGKDEEWLKKELKKKKITDFKKLLLVTANCEEIKFIQKRGK